MVHMVKYRFQPAFEVGKDSPAPSMEFVLFVSSSRLVSSHLCQSTNTRDMVHMVKYRFQPAFEVGKDSPAPPMDADKTRRPVCHWIVGTPDPETIARQTEFVDKLVAGVKERRKQAEERRKQAEEKPAKKKPAKKKPAKKKQWKKKFY